MKFPKASFSVAAQRAKGGTSWLAKRRECKSRTRSNRKENFISGSHKTITRAGSGVKKQGSRALLRANGVKVVLRRRTNEEYTGVVASARGKFSEGERPQKIEEPHQGGGCSSGA